MNTTSHERGMTLMDVALAVLVLGLALPPVTSLFRGVAKQSVDDTYQTEAVILADALMEEIASKAYEDPDLGAGSFGREELLRGDFDDVDDYDGLTSTQVKRMDGSALSLYAGLSFGIVIENVTNWSPGVERASPDGSTDYKRIQVTVSWTDGRGGEMSLTSLRTGIRPLTIVLDLLDDPDPIALDALPPARALVFDVSSLATEPLEIASFEVSSDPSLPTPTRLRMDSVSIWLGSASMPTGVTELNLGTAVERTIAVGASPEFEIRWSSIPTSGDYAATLVLFFTDGSSDHLDLPLSW